MIGVATTCLAETIGENLGMYLHEIRTERPGTEASLAPLCNIQCNFCDRRYDCVNESRPGVTASGLSPHQALSYLDQALVRDPRIAVVGIAERLLDELRPTSS